MGVLQRTSAKFNASPTVLPVAPSKASMLIHSGFPKASYSYSNDAFDARFHPEAESPNITTRAFSSCFLWHSHLNSEEPQYRTLVLRHEKADECPAQQKCNHWKLAKGDNPTREAGVVEISLLCLSNELIDKVKGSFEKGNLFDDEGHPRQQIRSAPCRFFNALKPDFSSVEKAGYTVVICGVVEEYETARKWMNQYGRLLMTI